MMDTPGLPFLCGCAAGGVAVWLCMRASRDNADAGTTSQPLPVAARRAGGAGGAARDPEAEESTGFDTVGAEDRVLRKAETVLQRRTGRFVVVVERCCTDHNHSAIIRTAEALGIQHLWLIDPPTEENRPKARVESKKPSKKARKRLEAWKADEPMRKKHAEFAQMATKWVTIREFATTAECIEALREAGRTIWVTDLSQQAECLTLDPTFGNVLAIPESLAIVFGSESVGCSDTMLEAADKRVYLPLHGFADSLNLSVSVALILQQLFLMAPDAVGDLAEDEVQALRNEWYARLARSDKELAKYMERVGNPPAPFEDMRRADGHRAGWRRKTDKAHMAHVADFRK